MTRDDDLNRLLDAVNELTRPRTTATAIRRYNKHRNYTKTELAFHTVTHPSMLQELDDAVSPTGGAGDNEGARGVPGSRPPARLAAIHIHLKIRDETTLWLIRLGRQSRDDLHGDIRGLLGAAGQMTADMLHWLTLDACRWVVWCRVVTGWQTPPSILNAQCPACDTPKALLMRWDVGVACCLTCGADWRKEDGSLMLLAEIINPTTGESA